MLHSIGNVTKCQTPKVLQQAAYEYRLQQLLAFDTITEVRMQMQSFRSAILGENGINGYIQTLAVDPFHVTLFTDRQVSLFLRTARRPEGCTIHFDSTGSVVRKFEEQKDPYFYCCILAGVDIPVFEFVTTDHRKLSIRDKLAIFLAACQQVNNNTPVLPKVVVTDFSYAMINAVLEACNTMTLKDYLRATFNTLRSSTTVLTFTIIALCNAHMLKAISNRFVAIIIHILYKHFQFIFCRIHV